MLTNTELIIAIYLHPEYTLCDCLDEHLGKHNIDIYHDEDDYVGDLNWDGTHSLDENHELILEKFIKEHNISYYKKDKFINIDKD
jgi:hypothetical protein